MVDRRDMETALHRAEEQVRDTHADGGRVCVEWL